MALQAGPQPTDSSAIRFASAPLAALAIHAQALEAHNVDRYLIVSCDSSSGSWDTRDESRLRHWRSQYGPNFEWFRQDGRDYLITDEAKLEKFHDAMAPPAEVNLQQRGEPPSIGSESQVNAHQREVNQTQSEVNRRQSLVNRGAANQSS